MRVNLGDTAQPVASKMLSRLAHRLGLNTKSSGFELSVRKGDGCDDRKSIGDHAIEVTHLFNWAFFLRKLTKHSHPQKIGNSDHAPGL
jgi:hypothetical protein